MAYETVIFTTTNKIPTKDMINEAQKRIIKTWCIHWDKYTGTVMN